MSASGTEEPEPAAVTSEELEEEAAVLEKHLKELTKSGDRFVGYVCSDEALQQLERDLAAINVSFQTETSRYKSPGDHAAKVRFATTKGFLPIALAIPFKVLHQLGKGCLFGRDRHPIIEQSSTSREGTSDSAPDTVRKKIRNSKKKKGCTAFMYVKKIEAYPEHRLDLPQGCSRKRMIGLRKEKLSALAQVMNDTYSAASVVREIRIYVSVPSKLSHTNHSFQRELGQSQPVSDDIIAKIHTLVGQGVTSVSEVERHLRTYVGEVLFRDRDTPDQWCRAFFPTRRDISTHVCSALRRQRLCESHRSGIVRRLRLQLYGELEECKASANECIEERVMRHAVQRLKMVQDFLQQRMPSVPGDGIRDSPGCSGLVEGRGEKRKAR